MCPTKRSVLPLGGEGQNMPAGSNVYQAERSIRRVKEKCSSFHADYCVWFGN